MNEKYKFQYVLAKIESDKVEVIYVTDSKEEFLQHIDKLKDDLFGFELTYEVKLITESDDGDYFYCVFLDKDDDIRKTINGLESRLIRYYNKKIKGE